MARLMAGEVICPRCGALSPTTARSCAKCGTALAPGAEKTAKSRSFDPVPPKGASAPRKPPTGAVPGVQGPVPQAGAAPRRSNARGTLGGGDSKDPLIGRKLQEYVLESRLGVGGMGVVYKAVQPMIGKHVAIKVLRADVVQDPRDMDRLLEEARVVSAIKHRGIINIFGAGTLEDGRHYLIMEMLEGESLEQLMQRDGQVNASDAVVILEQVLSALSAAHEAGIVHRDLKPANVFLVKEGNQFYVKLLDFGLARRQQQNVTRIAGTPDYISPEHARGRPAGPPADLYAFGILCFHMLTGKLPFTGNTPMEVMEKHVHSAPPVPHEVNPAIPKALSELILKLLAKDPGERPDAAQVKADLRAATKQMRNAATMMSLAAIDAVTSTPQQMKQEEKRAKTLARDAQVADLKRKVKKRWPFVLGGFVVLWAIGVAMYVMSPPPVEEPVKKSPKDPIVKNDPGKNPHKDPVKNPELVAPTLEDAGAVAVHNPDLNPVNTNPENPVNATAEEDAGEVLVEDPNAPLDDVRLGELKRQKGIDEKLDEIKATMRSNAEIRSMFSDLHEKTRKTCDAASTRKQIFDCEDEVLKLYNRYLKML